MVPINIHIAKSVRRRDVSPPRRFDMRWVKRGIILLSLIPMLLSSQNFKNRGTLISTGKIQIGHNAVNFPDTLGGIFELFGADQTLTAKQYQDVRLSGTGTKLLSGGNVSVLGSLTITAPVILKVPQGNIITLGDTLNETGLLLGAIRKSVNLTGSTTSSNFGNIGAMIAWTSNAPGITNVLRASDSTQFGNGNQSVRRYYHIQPTDATAVGTVTFTYRDAELNGHTESNLQLWRSVDNGSSWQRFQPVVDTLLNTISRTNVLLAGRWAMSDTVRALGPLQGGAGIPVLLAQASTLDTLPVILTSLDTIKVKVTDMFGSPVKNVPVDFAISARPTPQAGGVLSNTTDSTDESGFAATVFTLGNKVGAYKVIATSPSLNDTVKITAYAQNGAPQSLAEMPISLQQKQIFNVLDSSFTVEVLDIGGNAVDSAMVKFFISSIPTPDAFNQDLTNDSIRTDGAGRASTRLTLGSKVGSYEVSAVVVGVNDTARFLANALVGAAVTINRGPGDNQVGIVGTSVSPFVATIFDDGGNPVPNEVVKFKIASTPGGVDSGRLSVTSIPTNAQGTATSILTLGSKTGPYNITAENTTVGGTLSYTVTAEPAAPKSLARISGDNQLKPILNVLDDDFVVAVTDTFGNAVDTVMVVFSIDSLTANGSGARLSVDSIATDLNGLAATRLTLGSKSGPYKVNAMVNGVPVLQFNASASPGAAAAMQMVSGNGQTASIVSLLPNEFLTRVVDVGGNGVEGAAVLFRIDSVPANASGQQLSRTLASTDVNGFARTSLTLGNKVGRYVIKASSNGIADTFFAATATHGAAAAMMATAGAGQVKPILTSLDIPFIITVVDIGQNAVPQTDVQFTIIDKPAGDTSAALSASADGTDSLGMATTQLTLGSKVGVYTVKALVSTPNTVEASTITIGEGKQKNPAVQRSTAALLETTFTARAIHGAASSMLMVFGDRQVNPTETELDTAFVVSVRDRGNNPIPNDTVRFAIVAAPANATQQAMRDSVVLTDSTGTAKTFLTLGTREGPYTVRATAGNAPVQQFTANAYFIYGDINKDIAINNADITSLVDILNKKLLLSSSDSLKADFNRDNKIDTMDIGSIRQAILDRSLFTASVSPAAFLEEKNNAAYIAPIVKVKSAISANTKTVLEATSYGLRVNLYNDVPVRGVELRIHLKDSSLVLNKVNMLFKRAEMMKVFVSTKEKEVRVVAYNLNNAEIHPDSGSVFRLPFITSLDMIDSTEVTVALPSNMSAPLVTQKATAHANAYPATFRLSQNYPNPFNGSTTIEYDIPDGTEFTKTVIQVFNILGQRVKTLVAEDQQPGRYSVRWDGTDQNGSVVASGVYFYRLISKSHVGSRKMLYVK